MRPESKNKTESVQKSELATAMTALPLYEPIILSSGMPFYLA
jgi:hypothetical protein